MNLADRSVCCCTCSWLFRRCCARARSPLEETISLTGNWQRGYVDDNNQALPPTSTWPTSNGWESRAPSWAVGDAKHDVTTANLQRGLLFPYNRSVGIYRCPADKTPVVGNRSVLRTRTYQLDALLNYWYVGGIPPWYPDPWERRKFSELVNPQPTEVMTFIDSHTTTGDSADFAQS